MGDYLSSICSMASVKNDYFSQEYLNTAVLELPNNIYAENDINREVKNAQIALFDSLDHTTRDIVCQILSYFKAGI